MKILVKIISSAFFAGSIGTAQAIPFELTSTINPESSVRQTPSPITFDIGSLGFDTTLHALESASLSFVFTTGGAPGSANSPIYVSYMSQERLYGSASDPIGQWFEIPIQAFDLNSGLLTFDLRRTNNAGTVTLTSATLLLGASLLQLSEASAAAPVSPTQSVLEAVSPTQSLPEPGTLALLGLGLLGGVLARRRKA